MQRSSSLATSPSQSRSKFGIKHTAGIEFRPRYSFDGPDLGGFGLVVSTSKASRVTATPDRASISPPSRASVSSPALSFNVALSSFNLRRRSSSISILHPYDNDNVALGKTVPANNPSTMSKGEWQSQHARQLPAAAGATLDRVPSHRCSTAPFGNKRFFCPFGMSDAVAINAAEGRV